jgi:hypothetical protein
MISLLLVSLLAAQPVTVRSTQVRISGTSNLHDWSCQAGTVEPKIQVQPASAGPGLLPTAVTITVRVDSIRCGNDTMDGKLRDALKAAEHPTIHFVLASAQAVDPTGTKLLARGRLTIAGVSRDLAFVARLRRDGGEVEVSGDVPVEMGDYGVSPPTALLGMLVTGRQVVVHFTVSTLIGTQD